MTKKQVEPVEKILLQLTESDVFALAEIFLVLEKWQYETDLRLQKDSQHSDQHRNPTEFRQQD